MLRTGLHKFACPCALQGFVLGQYAMLWAMQNPDKVEKMVILNTPLGLKTKLRPELAAYKNRMAFLRPDPKVRNPCGTSTDAAIDFSRAGLRLCLRDS